MATKTYTGKANTGFDPGTVVNNFRHLVVGLVRVMGPRRAAIILVGILLGAVILCGYNGATRWLDNTVLDGAARMLAQGRAPDPRLAIVAIDTETLAAVPHRWPWPRTEMVRLLDAIGECAPQWIILDIVLQQPDSTDAGRGDQLLATRMRQQGNIGLVNVVETEESEAGIQVRQYHSLNIFREAAAFEGFVRGEFGDDGVIRSFVMCDHRLGVDSCALTAVKRLQPDTVSVPAPGSDLLSRSLLAFAQRDGGIPCYRAVDLLRGKVPHAALASRTVVLGVTADILHDAHQTALGQRPGVEILAVSIDTLLQGHTTTRLNTWPWRVGMGLLGLLLTLAATGLPQPRRRRVLVAMPILVTCVGVPVAFALCLVPPFGVFILMWAYGWFTRATLDAFLDFVTVQHVRAEAESVREIQALITPRRNWSSSGYRCSGVCLPCEEASGDYYDFFEPATGRLTVLIADVAGHGVSAAMIAVIAKAVATISTGRGELPPAKLLQTMNSALVGIVRRHRLMTALAGSLDIASNRVDLAFAGHPPAYVVRATGTVEEVGMANVPLGCRAVIPEVGLTIALQPGDHLILYTDGIPEALDWNDRQFDYDDWQAFACRELVGLPHDKVIERVLRGVENHAKGRPFTDDVTLLVLSRDP